MSIRNALCAPCDKNPQKAIAYAWFTSIVMVVVAFICACAAAGKSGGDGSVSLGFAAVWTVSRTFFFKFPKQGFPRSKRVFDAMKYRLKPLSRDDLTYHQMEFHDRK